MGKKNKRKQQTVVVHSSSNGKSIIATKTTVTIGTNTTSSRNFTEQLDTTEYDPLGSVWFGGQNGGAPLGDVNARGIYDYGGARSFTLEDYANQLLTFCKYHPDSAKMEQLRTMHPEDSWPLMQQFLSLFRASTERVAARMNEASRNGKGQARLDGRFEVEESLFTSRNALAPRESRMTIADGKKQQLGRTPLDDEDSPVHSPVKDFKPAQRISRRPGPKVPRQFEEDCRRGPTEALSQGGIKLPPAQTINLDEKTLDHLFRCLYEGTHKFEVLEEYFEEILREPKLEAEFLGRLELTVRGAAKAMGEQIVGMIKRAAPKGVPLGAPRSLSGLCGGAPRRQFNRLSVSHSEILAAIVESYTRFEGLAERTESLVRLFREDAVTRHRSSGSIEFHRKVFLDSVLRNEIVLEFVGRVRSHAQRHPGYTKFHPTLASHLKEVERLLQTSGKESIAEERTRPSTGENASGISPLETDFQQTVKPAAPSEISTGQTADEESGKKMRKKKAKRGSGEAFAAVSYTHLTLPTIYSV
eukprot:TRINITY_DN7104_c0_g1_i2.p1 TRINITY_DN7104_c0_g1~~TRINITY_DN7104_c0_g1_i2.p1  ORF type:complete len:529 (-),score=96.79 TRINITY_DN7104_c0_g1_i2:35-1621(-)